MSHTFRALIAEGDRTRYSTRFAELSTEQLPDGDVLVDIVYSSLNYKDALAVTGRGKVIRTFPLVCGIDMAGRVLESRVPEFRPGDEVLAIGHGLGETQWGGYSGRGRFNARDLMLLPAGIDLKGAMAIGTAGVTAMLALLALEHHGISPGERPVIVTGAAGGVGSIAIALLAGAGYLAAASTGRPELSAYLRELGATTIVSREDLARKGPPLGSERWAAGIDTVGGDTLASVFAATASYGAVAVCGLAGGSDLTITVFPFILRNVSLLGINSLSPPDALAATAWNRLARSRLIEKLDTITTVAPLSKVVELSEQILAGAIRGRVVVDVRA